MSDDPEGALIGELRTMAGHGGSDRSDFFLRHEGTEIRVSYTSGSSSSLVLSAGFDAVARRDHPALVARASGGYRQHRNGPLAAPRPLGIELRRESLLDREAKSQGLSVEWQSGDAAFDDTVYVATETTDAEVLAAVLGREVREAVIELLGLGFGRVTIDEDGAVRAYLSEFTRVAPIPQRGARAVRAFEQLLTHLPFIVTSGAPSESVPLAGLTRFLRVLGIVGWATNVGYVTAVLAVLERLHLLAPDRELSALAFVALVAAGIVCGVLGAKLYGGVVAARVRGTSRAHERAASAAWSAFGGVSVIAFTVLLVVVVVLGRPAHP